MPGCLNVSHDEVNCSHLPVSEQCETCQRESLLLVLANYGFEAVGFDESPDSFDLRIGIVDAETLVNILTAHEEHEEAQLGH